MMVIDYPNSKNTHNLKFMEFEHLKIENLLSKKLKFQKFFTTCKWGVMYMTFTMKYYFMI